MTAFQPSHLIRRLESHGSDAAGVMNSASFVTTKSSWHVHIQSEFWFLSFQLRHGLLGNWQYKSKPTAMMWPL